MTALPVMLNVSQLARLTGRGEATVRRWARDGTGPVRAIKVGGDWMFNAAAVERQFDIEVEDDAELRRLLDILDGKTAPRTWNGRSLVS